MTLPQSRPRSAVTPVFLTSLCIAMLALTGCGVEGYSKAVSDSEKELMLRSKFGSLGTEYYRFPKEADPRTKKDVEFPIAFRVPRVFQDDDKDVKQRWKSYGGKAVKLNSRDPFVLRNDQESRISIQPAYAIPPEFMDPSIAQAFAQAHLGTFIAEYKITAEDPPGSGNKNQFHQNLMMSIWVFDTTNRSRPVPSDQAVLQGVKRAGREPAALASINAAMKKAEKPTFKAFNTWEDEEIPTAPIPEKPKGSISAKLARIFVQSSFLNAINDQARRPVQKDGVVRLWSFKLEKYQVFLMLRAPFDLTLGDDAAFPLDAESPESDKLVDLGRAVIGSMVVVPESAPAATEEKKK